MIDAIKAIKKLFKANPEAGFTQKEIEARTGLKHKSANVHLRILVARRWLHRFRSAEGFIYHRVEVEVPVVKRPRRTVLSHQVLEGIDCFGDQPITVSELAELTGAGHSLVDMILRDQVEKGVLTVSRELIEGGGGKFRNVYTRRRDDEEGKDEEDLVLAGIRSLAVASDISDPMFRLLIYLMVTPHPTDRATLAEALGVGVFFIDNSIRVLLERGLVSAKRLGGGSVSYTVHLPGG